MRGTPAPEDRANPLDDIPVPDFQDDANYIGRNGYSDDLSYSYYIDPSLINESEKVALVDEVGGDLGDSTSENDHPEISPELPEPESKNDVSTTV